MKQEDPTPEEIEARKLTLPPRKTRRGPKPAKNNFSRREIERSRLGCFDGRVRHNSTGE